MTTADVNTDSTTDSTATETGKEVYNIFDGTNGRPTGRYLDMQERIEAEKDRAVAEGREPNLTDLGALPPAVGTPVVGWEQVPDNRYHSNPSTLTHEAATGQRKNVDSIFTSDAPTVDADDDDVADDEGMADDEGNGSY
jgi:hypothetical protein